MERDESAAGFVASSVELETLTAGTSVESGKSSVTELNESVAEFDNSAEGLDSTEGLDSAVELDDSVAALDETLLPAGNRSLEFGESVSTELFASAAGFDNPTAEFDSVAGVKSVGSSKSMSTELDEFAVGVEGGTVAEFDESADEPDVVMPVFGGAVEDFLGEGDVRADTLTRETSTSPELPRVSTNISRLSLIDKTAGLQVDVQNVANRLLVPKSRTCPSMS